MSTEEIMKLVDDKLEKATTTGYDFHAASVVQIPFIDAVSVWGALETPLLTRTARNSRRALSTTHKWLDAQVAAPAENAQLGAFAWSGLTGASVVTVARSNTCQIVAETIPVSASALQEAANGIYGEGAIRDLQMFETDLTLSHMLASIEYSMLFGVEVTEANESTARKMGGLIGTAGSGGYDDGKITAALGSTITDNSGNEFTQGVFDTFLRTILAAGAGVNNRPTACYCSCNVIQKIGTFSSNVDLVVSVNSAADLVGLPAGKVVGTYVAPWGGLVDLVYHPQNSHSATAANNWIAALCEDNVAPVNFRGDAMGGIIVKPVLVDSIDGVIMGAVWEGSIEARVPASHGILHDFTVTLPAT